MEEEKGGGYSIGGVRGVRQVGTVGRAERKSYSTITSLQTRCSGIFAPSREPQVGEVFKSPARPTTKNKVYSAAAAPLHATEYKIQKRKRYRYIFEVNFVHTLLSPSEH